MPPEDIDQNKDKPPSRPEIPNIGSWKKPPEPDGFKLQNFKDHLVQQGLVKSDRVAPSSDFITPQGPDEISNILETPKQPRHASAPTLYQIKKIGLDTSARASSATPMLLAILSSFLNTVRGEENVTIEELDRLMTAAKITPEVRRDLARQSTQGQLRLFSELVQYLDKHPPTSSELVEKVFLTFGFDGDTLAFISKDLKSEVEELRTRNMFVAQAVEKLYKDAAERKLSPRPLIQKQAEPVKPSPIPVPMPKIMPKAEEVVPVFLEIAEEAKMESKSKSKSKSEEGWESDEEDLIVEEPKVAEEETASPPPAAEVDFIMDPLLALQLGSTAALNQTAEETPPPVPQEAEAVHVEPTVEAPQQQEPEATTETAGSTEKLLNAYEAGNATPLAALEAGTPEGTLTHMIDHLRQTTQIPAQPAAQGGQGPKIKPPVVPNINRLPTADELRALQAKQAERVGVTALVGTVAHLGSTQSSDLPMGDNVAEKMQERNAERYKHTRDWYLAHNKTHPNAKDQYQLFPAEINEEFPAGTAYMVYEEDGKPLYAEALFVHHEFHQGMNLQDPLSGTPSSQYIQLPTYGKDHAQGQNLIGFVDAPKHLQTRSSHKMLRVVVQQKNRPAKTLYLQRVLKEGDRIRDRRNNTSHVLREDAKEGHLFPVDEGSLKFYLQHISPYRDKNSFKVTGGSGYLTPSDNDARMLFHQRHEVALEILTSPKFIEDFLEASWKAEPSTQKADVERQLIYSISPEFFNNTLEFEGTELFCSDIVELEEMPDKLLNPTWKRKIRIVLALENVLPFRVRMYEWRSDLPEWRYIHKTNAQEVRSVDGRTVAQGESYLIHDAFSNMLENLPVTTYGQAHAQLARPFRRMAKKGVNGEDKDMAFEHINKRLLHPLKEPKLRAFQEFALLCGDTEAALRDMAFVGAKPATDMTQVLPSAEFLDAVKKMLYFEQTEQEKQAGVEPKKRFKLERNLLLKKFEQDYCAPTLRNIENFVKGLLRDHPIKFQGPPKTTQDENLLKIHEKLKECLEALEDSSQDFLGLQSFTDAWGYNNFKVFRQMLRILGKKADAMEEAMVRINGGQHGILIGLQSLAVAWREELFEKWKQLEIPMGAVKKEHSIHRRVTFTPKEDSKKQYDLYGNVKLHVISEEGVIMSADSALGDDIITWSAECYAGRFTELHATARPRDISAASPDLQEILRTDPSLYAQLNIDSLGMNTPKPGALKKLLNLEEDGNLWHAFGLFTEFYRKAVGDDEQQKLTGDLETYILKRKGL